jgi:hypothetical protein
MNDRALQRATRVQMHRQMAADARDGAKTRRVVKAH